MTTTPISPESTVSAELIAAISSAYTEKDSTLSARVKVMRRALDAGFNVKQVTAAMTAAAAENPSIVAVSSTVYGFAAASARVLDTLGIPSSQVSSADASKLHRAAQHVKVGPFNTAIKMTLAPLGDDVSTADKLTAVLAACDVALSTLRSDRKAPSTREGRPNMGSGDTGSGDTGSADVPNNEHVHPAPGKPDAAETLAALRRATKYLAQGGTVDPIMASAISEFVAAAASASRRQPVAA